MRRVLIGIFAVIGVLAVLSLAGGLAAWRLLQPKPPQIAASTILDLDLSQDIAESQPADPVARLLFDGQPALRDLLDALQRAGDDPRVKGVVARVGNDGLGTATVQELREALAAFRAKGKFAIAFADTFGEFSPGNRSYYLATAFDAVWLQPLGELGLVGLRAESPFFRGTLDKLGIVPRLDHREEYKSAMNMVTDSKIGPAQLEETKALVGSVFGQIVRDVAQARHLPEGALRTIIDGGPYMAQDALKLHLVDQIGYRDEALAAARTRAGGIAALVGPLTYLDRAGRPNRDGPTIALIHADGLIARGTSSGGLDGARILGAETVSRAFRAALADPQVRAILLRIDSPGGSAVASETIWRETVRAERANIPVVVSMGDVAGSGGYYIAAAADKIVAQPATLTGSIGVVAGKMLTTGLWDKLGVGWAAAEQGQNAGMFSTLQDYTPSGTRHLESFLDAVYDGFKAHVAAGRHLDPKAVEDIAKGRVWTGEDAKARGLVDALGGYATALRLARIAANLDPSAPITLRTYPVRREPGALLVDWLLGRDREDKERLAVALRAEFTGLAAVLGPLRDGAAALAGPPGPATMTLSPELR